jgi:ribosome maturation factor RimP
MSNSPIAERISALVTPICADLGLDLYDCEYNGGQLTITIDTRLPDAAPDPDAPTRLAARIAADSRESARVAAELATDDDDEDEDDEGVGDEGDADGADDEPVKRGPGITLDVLALATRLISRELDHADPINGHYTLEVSSPGLERTLRTPSHFRRSVGTEVAIRLRDVNKDERRVHGVLTGATDDLFTVTRPDGSERHIPYDQVDRARTVFTWGPAPKPTKAKPKAKPAGKASAPPRTKNTTTPTAATDDTTEAPAP